MNPFTFHRAGSLEDALKESSRTQGAKFIGGGTNLIDLMKENIEHPSKLIDINHVGLKDVVKKELGLFIGALVTNSEAAYHPVIEQDYPLLADAILAGASPQLRNMATCGGNLLQRTRCYYFYDKAAKCNKREPGKGCDAKGGFNRIHAIFGASESCIAVHPSDMCVALAALSAKVKVCGENGERSIEFKDFHRLPGDTPEKDTILLADEMIVALELGAEAKFDRHAYVKVRDRSSYAFALVSFAVGLKMEGETIRSAAVAMGGAAHKPWRDFENEGMLAGQKPSAELFAQFAEKFFADARGQGENDFKIQLGKRVLVRALNEALGKVKR